MEPSRTGRLPYTYSLLYHQTMSTLASCGEMTPGELAFRVLTLSCFRRISQKIYRLLLRHLLEIDHISRTENGASSWGMPGSGSSTTTNSMRCSRKCPILRPLRPGGTGHHHQAAPGREQGCHGRTDPAGGGGGSQKAGGLLYSGIRKNSGLFWRCGGDIHNRILERVHGVMNEQKRPLPDASRNMQAGGDSRHLPKVRDGASGHCAPGWAATPFPPWSVF